MRGSRWIAGSVVVMAVVAGAGFQRAKSDDAKEPAVIVRGGALGASVQVLGRLDEPLGTLVTVRGRMVAKQPNEKGVDIKRMFEVLQVGDRTLAEPRTIDLSYEWYGEKPVAPGTPLELIGFETGGFYGISAAEYEWQDDPRNRRGDPGMRQDYRWHFDITFHVLQYDQLPAAP